MIDKLMKRPLDEATLIEITSIIQNQTLGLLDYYKLTQKQLEILNNLGRYQELIVVAESFLKTLSEHTNLTIESQFYFLIFNAAIEIKDFKKAYHYLQKREQTLPILEKHLAIYDIVKFRKLTNQPYETELENVLQDDLDIVNKVNYSVLLLDSYLKSNNYAKMYALASEVSSVDLEGRTIPYLLESLFKLEQYDECIKVANELIKKKGSTAISFYYLLKIYIEYKNVHQITILDGEYSSYIDELSLNQREEVYKILVEFYDTLIKNKHSHEFYQKKLKEVISLKKKEEKREKEILKEEEITNKIVDLTPTKSILVTQFEIAHEMTLCATGLLNNPIRDFLRPFFINLAKHLDFSKVVIYTSKDNTLFSYFKERLYDKKVTLPEIAETIFFDIINEGNEIFSETKYLTYQKDILTQNNYEESVKFVYSFPLEDLGAISFYLNHLIKPDQYYDIYRHVSELVFLYLSNLNNRNVELNELNLYKNFLDSKIIPIRILNYSFASINERAQKLLEISKSHLIEDYVNEMDIPTQQKYFAILNKVRTNANEIHSITYQFNDRMIEEKLISFKKDSNSEDLTIFSIFTDLTKFRDERDLLIKQATVCELTGLNNKNQLVKDLPNYLDNKGSLVLIELSDNLKVIYGTPRFTQFFKEFAQYTKKYFNNLTLYRYDDYQVFIYLDSNDIRTVDNIMRKYNSLLTEYKPKTISYEKFVISASIIRYPVVTKEKDIKELFKYLELSLNRIRNLMHENNFIYFEYPIYEEELLEQQIIDYINLGIETKQLDFTFKPIINHEKRATTMYESILMIPNLSVDSKYIYQVARKRSRHIWLDRFHLSLVVNYLKDLKNETNKLINVVIPLHRDTFSQSSFNQFFIKLIKENNIPGQFITLKITNNLNGKTHFNKVKELKLLDVKIAVSNLKENIDLPVDMLYFNYNYASKQLLEYLKVVNTYAVNNNITICCDEIETIKQQNEILTTGINLTTGSLYPVMSPDKLLLKIKNQL